MSIFNNPEHIIFDKCCELINSAESEELKDKIVERLYKTFHKESLVGKYLVVKEGSHVAVGEFRPLVKGFRFTGE